jgi:hypothetical protein
VPKYSPNGVVPVRVALLATPRLESFEVKSIPGKTVPSNFAVPDDAGEPKVQAAYTPVPLTALDIGSNAMVAAVVVAITAVKAIGIRRFTDVS